LWAQERIPVVKFTVDGYGIVGENPLDPQATQQILAQYTGQFEGLDGLLSAAEALQAALGEAWHPFHRVTLPPQTLQSGMVQLRVVAFSLGDIIIEGNEHFSDNNIRYSLPGLSEGMTPNTARFARSLNLANRHPCKQVAINLKQSTKADAIDAIISVEDRRPWQVFMSANNIGSKASGRSRLSVGAQYTNLFNRDYSITGNFTTSPENGDDVTLYGFNYQAPLYQYSTYLTAFYTKSDVDTGLIGGFFDVSGTGDVGFNLTTSDGEVFIETSGDLTMLNIIPSGVTDVFLAGANVTVDRTLDASGAVTLSSSGTTLVDDTSITAADVVMLGNFTEIDSSTLNVNTLTATGSATVDLFAAEGETFL